MALQRLEGHLRDILQIHHSEARQILGWSVGGNSAEFFSSSPIADLQAGLQGLYSGDRYPRMCTEIGLIDPSSPLYYDRGFEWSHLKGTGLNARVSVKVTPPHEDDAFTLLGRNGNVNTTENYIIQYYLDGQAPPIWRHIVAAALDRESIASRVTIELGFARLDEMQRFFGEKGFDYQSLVRRQMYLSIATNALYKISTVTAAAARHNVEAMIAQAKFDDNVPIDLNWLRQIYDMAQLPLPGKIDERVTCYQALGQDSDNKIELSATWKQRVRWNSGSDQMELTTDTKGAAPKHRLTVLAQPMRLTDDPEYQKTIIDLAVKTAGLPNGKLPVSK